MRFNRYNQSSEDPSLAIKLAVAAVYLTLGYTVASSSLSMLISIYFVLIILYSLLIQPKKYSVPYFLRYHILQALFLNICLAVVIWFLINLFQFLVTIPGISIIASFVWTLLNTPLIPVILGAFSPILINVTVMCFAITMAGFAFTGQRTRLPFISDAVKRFD